jgi:hypothetical protein
MDDRANVYKVDRSLPGAFTSGIVGKTVKMREVGQAVYYTNGTRDHAIQLLQSKKAATEDGLMDSCKTLFIGDTEIVDGPATDRLRRTHAVGWYGVYGSPEWDWFEKHFPCMKPHGYAPTTIRGSLRLAWQIGWERVTRPFRKREFDYRDEQEED